jgi:hypothetical protein
MPNVKKAVRLEKRIKRLDREIADVTRRIQLALASNDLVAYQKWNKSGRKLGKKQDRLRRRIDRYVY